MGTLLLKVTKRQKTTRAFERCPGLLHPLVWASPLTAWHLTGYGQQFGQQGSGETTCTLDTHMKVMLMKCYLLK